MPKFRLRQICHEVKRIIYLEGGHNVHLSVGSSRGSLRYVSAVNFLRHEVYVQIRACYNTPSDSLFFEKRLLDFKTHKSKKIRTPLDLV